MPEYEYRIEEPRRLTSEYLNEMAAKGWRTISVATWDRNAVRPAVVFERLVPDTEPRDA